MRGSPRSPRLRSFSCLLLELVASFSPPSSDEAAEDRPKTIGEMTEVHNLKIA